MLGAGELPTTNKEDTMDLKSLIQKRTANKPPRIVVHGIHGVGKSLFAK